MSAELIAIIVAASAAAVKTAVDEKRRRNGRSNGDNGFERKLLDQVTRMADAVERLEKATRAHARDFVDHDRRETAFQASLAQQIENQTKQLDELLRRRQ